MNNLAFVDSILNTTIDDHKPLKEIIELIQSDQYKEVCNKITIAEKKISTQLKKANLPIFYPCVNIEKYRVLDKNTNIESTGIIQFDIDECSDFKKLIHELQTIPELIYSFISPSGGVKFGIATDYKLNNHESLKSGFKHAYEIVKEYVGEYSNFKADDSVNNIAQSCFLSHDPNAYINLDAPELKVLDNVEKTLLEIELNRNHEIDIQFKSKEFNGVDTKEALKALKSIPSTLRYSDRLPINMAIISIFGDEAYEILINHWSTQNKAKLKQDIRGQIGRANGSITIASLFSKAIEHGYQTRSTNVRSKKATKPPLYNQTIYSLKDGKTKLAKSIDDFFLNKKSKLINFEAGTGKTKISIKRAYEYIQQHHTSKIAIFVASHKIAEQYKKDFLKVIEKMNPLAKTSSDMEKMRNRSSNYFWLKVNVQHIKGRHVAGMCNHDLMKRLNTEKNQDERLKLKNVINNNISKVCLTCKKSSICKYVQQFDGTLGGAVTNIRIYTHDALFNDRSIWDSGSYEHFISYKPLENNDWIPNYIIVDEDIVSKAASSNDIETTTYKDATPLLKEIMDDMRSKELSEIVQIRSKEIVKGFNEQKKKMSSWNKLIEPGLQDSAQLLIDRSRLYPKPKEYKVLFALNKFADSLQEANNIHANYHAIYLDKVNNTLNFAGRKYIHDRFKDIPTLLLDASADEMIVKSTFGKKFEFESISIEYQDNVNIFQIENNTYSKSSLKNDLNYFNKLKNYIKNKSKGKKFGLITYQNLYPNDGFGNKLSEATKASKYGYFGNVRGINSFEELDQLFIVGRHNIGWGLTDYYRQLFGGLKDKADPFCFDRNVTINNVYRIKSGDHRQISQFTYGDTRMVALDKHFHKAETYQAVHRLRLIHGSKPKEVYILSSEVLDITVDELIRTEKSRSTTDNRIIQIQDYIIEHKYLRNKNSDIRNATNIEGQELKNLKRKDFIQRVLANDKIQFVQFTGTNEKNRQAKYEIFVKTGDVLIDEWKLIYNLKKIENYITRKCN